MPIYEFHCGKCDKDSEILVRSSKWEGTRCPHCGAAKLQKKLSVFASSGGESTNAGPGACGINGGGGSCGCACGSGGRKHKHKH